MLGIGGQTTDGPEDVDSAILRFGWERTPGPRPGPIVIGAALETELRDYLLFVPYASVGTPLVFVFPSLGVGVGLPVRALPSAALGFRLEGAVDFPVVGFRLDWDLLRPLDSRGWQSQLTLFATLGF